MRGLLYRYYVSYQSLWPLFMAAMYLVEPYNLDDSGIRAGFVTSLHP